MPETDPAALAETSPPDTDATPPLAAQQPGQQSEEPRLVVSAVPDPDFVDDCVHYGTTVCLKCGADLTEEADEE